MALLEILQAPHPVLKTKAKSVARVDEALRRLAADMIETMYTAPGIGLAAPQVGVSERLIVLDVADGDAQGEAGMFIGYESRDGDSIEWSAPLRGI